MGQGFLVVGAEGTGTRAVTGLLVRAGCYGDDTHVQRLDSSAAPPRTPRVVWRRSFPHALRWPQIHELVETLSVQGYSPHVVVTTRDWTAAAQSQVAATHVTTLAAARANLRRAYEHIFSGITLARVPYTMTSYESFVAQPKAIGTFLSGLKLPALPDAQFYDGNAKWFP